MFDLATLLDLLKSSLPTLDVTAVDPAKPLAQQGVDSLDHANLLLQIEESTTIRIPDEDVERLATALSGRYEIERNVMQPGIMIMIGVGACVFLAVIMLAILGARLG